MQPAAIVACDEENESLPTASDEHDPRPLPPAPRPAAAPALQRNVSDANVSLAPGMKAQEQTSPPPQRGPRVRSLALARAPRPGGTDRVGNWEAPTAQEQGLSSLGRFGTLNDHLRRCYCLPRFPRVPRATTSFRFHMPQNLYCRGRFYRVYFLPTRLAASRRQCFTSSTGSTCCVGVQFIMVRKP